VRRQKTGKDSVEDDITGSHYQATSSEDMEICEDLACALARNRVRELARA
jgi:hypothetical protein